jgi:gliding motility-associated-like protein
MRTSQYLFLLWLSASFCCIQNVQAQVPFEVKGRLCAPDPGCKVDSTIFADTLKTATAWQWNFGDGGSSTKKAPKHFYQQAGDFNVSLIRTVAGIQETVTKMVTIGKLPPIFQQWKKDTTICPGTKYKIDPYPTSAPAGASYLWYPTGDTTQTITTDSSGCYSVEVKLANGCSYEDKIKIKVCLEQSQKEGAKWYFGSNAGLDFSGGSPRPLTNGQLNTTEGTTSISNTKGKLLFYTDGLTIYDRNHAQMASKDTAKLKGSPNSSQSALIVPQPTCRGCEYLYYVFTTTEINGQKQFSYSLVDMRRNMGKGEVVQKNIPLNKPTTERIASVRNDRDSTYWIVTHDYGNNVFRVYHATNAGLQEAGVFPTGATQNKPTEGEGYMKFSPKDSTGKQRLAIVVPGPPRNRVQIFDFNDSTGSIVGRPLTLDLGPAPPKAYGVEFSPDASKMYVSLSGNGTAAAPSLLWQYDISLNDSARITESKILIDSSATQIYGALQIGSDDKIYLAIKDSEYLGVVNVPNEDSQLSVKFVSDGIYLAGRKSQLGLPNFVQNFTESADGPGFMVSDTCSGLPTNFQASPLCDPLKDTYTWNYGDGSAPVSGKQASQAHTYAKAGTYKVSLRLVNQCKDTLISKNVTIIATPETPRLRSIPDTCVNTLDLDAGVTAERYLWLRNGFVVGRTKKITITNAQSGAYQLVVANGEEGQCPAIARAQIMVRKPPPFTVGADTSLCIGNNTSILLDAKRATLTRWDSFKWSTGETTQTITVKQAGTYAVQVKNDAQCINTDTLIVKALPKARLQATLKPPTGCTIKDGSITITDVLPNAVYKYQWFGPTNTPIVNTTNILADVGQGTYKILLSGNAAVCATDSSFKLEAVNNLRITPTIVNARCTQPTAGTINIVATSGTPVSYSWTNTAGMAIGINAALINNLSPGKYNVKVIDNTGCETKLDNITVGIIPERFVNLGSDGIKCIGDTVILTPNSPVLVGNQYVWTTADTTKTIVVSKNGTYKVNVTNSLTGCTDADDVKIEFVPRPVYEITKEVPLCEIDGRPALLIIRGAPNLSYLWLRNEQREPRISVSQAGFYPVRISNPEGCVLTDTAKVLVRCEPQIYVPEVFTPNGDGQNDKLDLFGDHFLDFEFRVFNRWGEVIFYTNDISQKWDGTFKGTAYPPMSYAWTVSFRPDYAPGLSLITRRGAVVLIR